MGCRAHHSEVPGCTAVLAWCLHSPRPGSPCLSPNRWEVDGLSQQPEQASSLQPRPHGGLHGGPGGLQKPAQAFLGAGLLCVLGRPAWLPRGFAPLPPFSPVPSHVPVIPAGSSLERPPARWLPRGCAAPVSPAASRLCVLGQQPLLLPVEGAQRMLRPVGHSWTQRAGK